MEIAKLVLEYVRAIVWPFTVFSLSLFFRSEIKRVLARLKQLGLPGGSVCRFTRGGTGGKATVRKGSVRCRAIPR